MTDTSLRDRIDHIRRRITLAAEKSGRNPSDIQLIGVTKTVDEPIILEALTLGLTDIGENRVQEGERKSVVWDACEKKGVRRHLLGPIQTNKARKAVKLFDMIQSVDRPRAAEFLNRVCEEEGTTRDCLIEVKISPEETKAGISLQDAPDFIRSFKQYSRLSLKGLMTIAPFDLPDEETRRYFNQFASFFEEHKQFLGDTPILSMGMTDDFEIAIEEGSTMVRIGRAIFGERDY